MSVCVRERDRERERVCVCVCHHCVGSGGVDDEGVRLPRIPCTMMKNTMYHNEEYDVSKCA